MVIETNARLGLRETAAYLNDRYAGDSAPSVIADLSRRVFPGKIGLVSSFGAEAAVLLHMVAQIDRAMPVIFLDTLKHFSETLEYRDALAARLGLTNLQVVRPTDRALAADDPRGDLHKTNTDLCCHVRKSIPMLRALQPLQCWITGRKRHQASSRSAVDLFETQDRWIKVNPLYDWSAERVQSYFDDFDLPPHPLKAQGYPSIGCQPCTRAVAQGEDARAGRWAGQEKTECGIHFVDGVMVRG